MRPIIDYALEYARRGWMVFPLHGINDEGECTCGTVACGDKGKHPRTARGLKEASRDPVKLQEWFGSGAPLSNIGLLTGEKSGITVLDIDVGPGKDGAQTWTELNRESGEPVTLVGLTGGGGMHFVFKYNSVLNTSSNTLGKGVDCRNNKGYIVAPPSLHRSGERYKWQDYDVELGDLPAHLTKKKERRGRPRADDHARKKYSIEEVQAMLACIAPEDRDVWRNVGVILGREFSLSDLAWKVYCDWSAGWGGTKGRNHDEIMHEAFYVKSQERGGGDGGEGGGLTLGTIVHLAIAGGWAPTGGQVPVENFIFYAPANNFIYRPTGAFWPAESVDATAPMQNDNGTVIKASVWLKRRVVATSMTNDPLIEGDLAIGLDCLGGFLVETGGAAVYNSYRKPRVELGDARLAGPFVEHVRRVFNKDGDADQFLNYLAHRAQRPGDKARFALLIAGPQGVGKDTAISMCYAAIGTWNVANIDPSALESNFNEHLAATLVVISEAANTHEMNKWAFNERTKNLIAGLPDIVPINPKYGQKYFVRNHCGTIVTTNHMLTGIYIPADDRRYDVIEAASKAEMFGEDPALQDEKREEYFRKLWTWYYENEGDRHVAAMLVERDISKWSAENGQRKTRAHAAIVSQGFAQDAWIGDALCLLGEPDLVRLDELYGAVEKLYPGEYSRKEFVRQVSNSIERIGFSKLISPSEADGRWSIRGEDGQRKKVIVYYRPEKLQIKEAVKMIAESRKLKF